MFALPFQFREVSVPRLSCVPLAHQTLCPRTLSLEPAMQRKSRAHLELLEPRAPADPETEPSFTAQPGGDLGASVLIHRTGNDGLWICKMPNGKCSKGSYFS